VTRILIVQRGWVFVGEVSQTETGTIVVKHTKSIRRWGTTEGLGQLRNGPLQETVLDQIGEIHLHPLQVIGQIAVDAEKWKQHLDH
jgi:hypothetical protein